MWFLWDNPLVTTFIRLDNLVGMHQGPPGAILLQFSPVSNNPINVHQGPYYCNFHQFPLWNCLTSHQPTVWRQLMLTAVTCWTTVTMKGIGCAPKYSDTIMCKVYRLALIRTMPLILNLAAHSVLANSNFDCHFSPLRTLKASKKLSTEHKHMSNLAATDLN